MWFFGRAFNIATWVIIRDAIRADMKEYARRQAKKENEKRAEKLRKSEEKERKQREKYLSDEAYFSKVLNEENSWRKGFDKKAKEWEIEHEREYQMKLYDAWHLVIDNIEKYEIKEWIKAEVEDSVYPEVKLKYNDEWKLSVEVWVLGFSGSVRETTLKDKDIKTFEIYKNGFLIIKNKGKNMFFKIDDIAYDTKKLANLLSWIPVHIEKDEWDYELKLKIAEYLTKGWTSWHLDLLDMADSVWSTVLDCARLTKQLENAWVVSLSSDEWKKTKTIDEVRKERAWDLIPWYVKVWKIILVILKWIGIIIWWLIWLIIFLAIIF